MMELEPRESWMLFHIHLAIGFIISMFLLKVMESFAAARLSHSKS